MNILFRIYFVVNRFLFKKIICPTREFVWSKKIAPFMHTTVKGLKFILYPGEVVDRHIFVQGLHERRFLEYIEYILPDSNTMLDVGANIGNHSLFCSKFFQKIHSFEPNPTVLDRIRKNIEINKIDNIVIHPYGLACEDGDQAFFVNQDGNLGGSFIGNNYIDVSQDVLIGKLKEIKITTVHGDNYIRKINIVNIDLIKIDVEGFEFNVLKGLVDTIKINRPIIAFEYHGQNHMPTHYSKLLEYLVDYRCFELRWANENDSILKKALFNFVQLGKPILELIEDIEPRTYENIISIPRENRLIKYLKLID